MSTDATHSIGDVPTEPGWYRAVVMNTWEVVKVTRGPVGLKALVLGEWRAFDWGRREGGGLVVSEWGARVEFPGDEPASVGLSDECELAAARLRLAIHNQRDPNIPATWALHVLLDEIIRIQKRAEEPRPIGDPLTVRDTCARADGQLRQLGRCAAQAGEALGVSDPSTLSWRDVLDEARKLRAPAAGPLTPDSEGWWWHRCGEPDKPEGMCDWQPRHVVVRLAGTDKGELGFDYGRVKDDGRWGGRAVPPVTPAVEADEQTLEPPLGWTIQEDNGSWRCHESSRQLIHPGGSTRHDAIAAAWECVRKRDAEPQDDPMTAKGADLNAVGRRLGVLRRYKSPDWETDEAFRGRLASAGGVRKREAPPAGWRVTLTAGLNWRASRAGTKGSFIFATYEEALAHARRCVDDVEHESLPVGVPRAPEHDWTWVEACPEGERREQTMYVGGDAVEDRVVDRKDEP